MEEAQIATAQEVEGQVPRTPEEHAAESRQKAIDEFNKAVSTKLGRQVLKKFLNAKANAYLTQGSKTLTRKQRRFVARQVGNRLTKKVLSGEDIFNAGV